MDGYTQIDVFSGTTASVDYKMFENVLPVYSPSDPGFARDVLLIEEDRLPRITHANWQTYSPIWQAVSMISGDVAKLPLHVYRTEPDGETQRATDHPAYWLLRRHPSSILNRFRFWRRVVVDLLLYQNAYAWIWRTRQTRRPLELVPLLAWKTRAFHDEMGGLWYATAVHDEGQPQEYRVEVFPAADVLHFEGLAQHGNHEGMDLIEAARKTLELGISNVDFATQFFRMGGRIGGLLEVPAGLSKERKDKIETDFRSKYETSQAFKTVVLRDGSKFHQSQMSPEQAQGVERSRESVKDVARYFNLAPSRMGEENRSSYNSKAEDNRDYLDRTLSHPMEAIREECNLKLLSPEELTPRGDGPAWYVEYETDAFVRGSMVERYQAYQIGIQSEFLSPDDVRRKENMPRRPDGRGDEFRNPNTRGGAESSVAQNRIASLLSGTIGRVVEPICRRAAAASKQPQKFCDWLDGSDGLDGYRENLSKALADVCEAWEAVGGPAAADTASGLADGLLSDLRTRLEEAASSASPEVLRDYVDSAIHEYRDGVGRRMVRDLEESLR